MKELVTPNQVAKALGVSEASLKRWCDKGLLPVIRTAGGHRRLPINGVLKFIRGNGHHMVRPEVLGLPPATGRSNHAIERMRQLMREAVESGDEQQVRRLVFNLYLGGHPVTDICDAVIAPAFHDIGDRWSHGSTEVYEERRGVEICLRVLHQLRAALTAPDESAPQAIGGTLEGDFYSIPTTMVELALIEAGWRAQSYGSGHPAPTLVTAMERVRPRLFWLGVSHISDEPRFVSDCEQLYETAEGLGIAFIVGGQALTGAIRGQIRYSAFCDTLRHVVAFVKTLEPAPKQPGPATDASSAGASNLPADE